jgi:hypothetical protein
MIDLTNIEHLVEEITDMSADQLWDLAKLLHRVTPVNANILKADLDFVESM